MMSALRAAIAPLVVASLVACSSSEGVSPVGAGGSGAGDAGAAGGGGGVARPAWLASAAIKTSGHGVENKDCRTGICRHNENTDMIAWGGAIWLVHRTAESQILGPNSSLVVFATKDAGATFPMTARIEAPSDRDLRDPSFYVVADELCIKAISRLPVNSTRDSNVKSVSVRTCSKDGATWSDLAPIGPETWSFWRVKEQGGVFYSAAYEDGDASVALFSSKDGATWTKGATVYDVAADTPLETELVFMKSGRLLALVRMDGTNDELLGTAGRLRTKVCWAEPPYAKFDCPSTIDGQRLDGPLAFFHGERLFVVARKHLPEYGRKRTALFELTGTLDGGPISLVEHGELPSAGDTSYAGYAPIDADHGFVSWYAGDLDKDEAWVTGMFDLTDIWLGTLDFTKL
jgi:hypothetical protein